MNNTKLPHPQSAQSRLQWASFWENFSRIKAKVAEGEGNQFDAAALIQMIEFLLPNVSGVVTR